jgi:hypothetical protein
MSMIGVIPWMILQRRMKVIATTTNVPNVGTAVFR